VKPNKGYVLFFCAAALLPGIFLFFLYGNNRVMNNLYLVHFIILGAILAAVSFCLFLLFRKIVRSNEGALLVLLLSWAFFWMFEQIYAATGMLDNGTRRFVLLTIIIAIIVAVLLCFRWLAPLFQKGRELFPVFSIILCALFAWNFVPPVYAEMSIMVTEHQQQVYELNTDFVVDESLPHPDVYWFHMDGMLGFDAVEKYFGDSQDELKGELTSRGFVLNESAMLNAGYTIVAVPALTCPTFYDSYLGSQLAEVGNLITRERRAEMNKTLSLDGIDIAKDVNPNLELFSAFIATGYTGVQIASYDYFRPNDWFYRTNNQERPLIMDAKDWVSNPWQELDDEVALLTTSSAFSLAKGSIENYIEYKAEELWNPIPDYKDEVSILTEKTHGLTDEKRIYRRLIDSFNIPSSKLVYIVNNISHGPFDKIYDTNQLENPSPDEPQAVELLYLPQHKYAGDMLIITIDMVLEQNPDAVIVVQADHGMHMLATQRYLTNNGYSRDEILELNRSVISAVRIPEQYGSVDEPIAPLNISRVLVNSFVGENYKLLK